MTLKLKHKAPRVDLIEKTALEMAAAFYEIGRSSGMTSKHKTAKHYARANLEKFIQPAVNTLLDMLNSPDYNEHIKQEIYVAVMERVHDPDLAAIDGKLPNIDISKVLDCKPDAPVIVNSQKFEPISVGIQGSLTADDTIKKLKMKDLY